MHRTKNFSHIAKRVFSAQPQTSLQDGQSAAVSKLSNGLKIATCNENASASRLSLLVRTGSRNDKVAELGLTHCLQACAGLTSSKNTAFLTTQLLSSLGATLDVTAGRDYIMYNINCFETAANELIVNVLTPSILSAKFPWYEVRDHVESKMKFQKAYAEDNPYYVLMESLHKASFRGEFGNPIMSPDYMIGKHTTEMLTSKFNNGFVYDNMVLAGHGIGHNALQEIGSRIDGLNNGASVKQSSATFVSSEVHVDRNCDLSYVALGFKGVSLNDPDTVALAVLQQALSGESNIKRGSGAASGILNQALLSKTKSSFSTSAFSVNYSDSGLFGITVVAPKDSIADVVACASSELSAIGQNGLDADTLQVAKHKLKSQYLRNASSSNYVADVAYQASVLDSVASPQDVASMIDRVAAKDVKAAAGRVLGGKRSLAVVGQSYDGPYLEDL